MKKSHQVAVKVTPDLKNRIEAMAKKLDRSQNWLAIKYITEGLDRDERRLPKD